MTWSAALSDIHPDPAKRRERLRSNIARGNSWEGGSSTNGSRRRINKGSRDPQKVGEDAPLARRAILFDLGWGELTNTRTPCFLRKRWETRPKLGARAWQGG